MGIQNLGKYIFAGLGVIAIIVLVTLGGRIVEDVGAEEIVIIQDPIDGDLHFYVSPGMKYQNFGASTHYPKSFQLWFSVQSDQGSNADQSMRTRFNDGGHATISGSVRIDMPLDDEHLRAIHTKYGSPEAVEQAIVRTVFEKAVYMSGPLMSSKESYAEKRNELIRYIEDQASSGVYKTISKETTGIDPMTGVKKTITVVELVTDDTSPNGIARQEESPLKTFGLRAYNLSINQIAYDDTVEAQIKSQQQAIMQVQTAIAEAKQAEQRTITVEQEGMANAAKAKWDQEVHKAKAVTEAEQKKEVAKLAKDAAEYTKQEQILLGEGEAERKRLVMEADGALEKKLATYEAVMGRFAQEFAKQKWVPEVQMNGGSAITSASGNEAANLINILTAKTLKDLGLDLSVKSGKANN